MPAGRTRAEGRTHNNGMRAKELHDSLTQLFAELTEGPKNEAFILNTGDIGLLRSLDKLSAADASRSTNEGATIAAHAQHLRYGLSLMNKWAAEGGNPFADAKWDEAWKISTVDDRQWQEIREGLAERVQTLVWRFEDGARAIRARALGNDRERGAPGLSPWRDQTDSQGDARPERRHLLISGPSAQRPGA